MRTLLVMVLSVSLVGAARADGSQNPEEPKAAPAQPAPAAPAPVAAPPAQEAVPAAAMPGPADEIEPNPSRKYGWAFLGAAGGAFVIAIATAGAAAAKAKEQEGDPAHPPVYTRSLLDSGKSGSALANASVAFTIVGAALAVIDGVVWFECLRKPKVLKKSTASIELTPMGVRF